MIIDKVDKLINYIPEQYKSDINDFIKSINIDMHEGQYNINANHIYAKVMSYDTKIKQNCKIEAHNRYIDIQLSITGSERIDIFSREDLKIEKPYDEMNDVEFYIDSEEVCYASNVNKPGYFSIIYPYEAHRPQRVVNTMSNRVKKIVIKIEVYDEV